MTPEDAILFLERDMEEVELIDFCGGQAAIYSKSSPTRDNGGNQDAAVLIPFDEVSGALVVADGAGGTRGGAQASATTVYELCASLEAEARAKGDLRTAILNGIENANREISTLAIGAATTVAVAEVRESNVRPYHVGDSQILLLGQKGKLKLLTVSHSPVGYAVESGLMDETEAMHHADRHFVSNVVGSPQMTIEMGVDLDLSPRDTLLVACDGLFDNLSSLEVIEHLRTGDLRQATADLVTECRLRMMEPTDGRPSKPDDLTLIVYRR